jgi:hypothetical protein
MSVESRRPNHSFTLDNNARKSAKYFFHHFTLLRLLKLLDVQVNSELVNKVWNQFGSYLERLLTAGRGIAVPKLGVFTFSATSLDMAVRINLNLKGTTNPQDRDH